MVEFLEDTHTYLVDGVIVPSVTTIVGWVMKDDFSHIPSEVLQKKAEHGTLVHEYIQAIENGMTYKELCLAKIDPNVKAAVNEYRALKKKSPFTVKSMEQIVYNTKCAGRYDILTTDNELIDIKTTYRLNEEHLQWQLGLYYYLMGMEKKYGFVMWLPKQTDGCFKAIEVKSNKECEELIEAFLNTDG